MRPTSCSVLAVASLLLTVACGDDSESMTWTGAVDTLDNGTILVSNPATGLWDSASVWQLAEGLRIGTQEGDAAESFSVIHDLAVDRWHRIYVLDRQSQEIRVFDARGAYVHTSGRSRTTCRVR